MPTGHDVLKKAAPHVGEAYHLGVMVPKNNAALLCRVRLMVCVPGRGDFLVGGSHAKPRRWDEPKTGR